jgi:hypothetical protein
MEELLTSLKPLGLTLLLLAVGLFALFGGLHYWRSGSSKRR